MEVEVLAHGSFLHVDELDSLLGEVGCIGARNRASRKRAAPNRMDEIAEHRGRSTPLPRPSATAAPTKPKPGEEICRLHHKIKAPESGAWRRLGQRAGGRRNQDTNDLPILKKILAASDLLSSKWKKQEELVYVTTYDILFGQEIAMTGTVEKFFLHRKIFLQSTLAKLVVKEKAKSVEDLLPHNKNPVLNKPRYIRVNTLKMDSDSAMRELATISHVLKDDMVPDLLVLPSGTDLHNHPLVANGSIFLQGKASSMVAVALCPRPQWKVRAILLDPSCSGSGITTERLDYLLPSYNAGNEADAANTQRVKKLAAFQRKALAHALSFPAVERVVYSTCSIHQEENEDVIESVLPLASSLQFELATPFPNWSRRGLPVFEGAECLLRTDPTEDTEGFFIALFVRKSRTTGTKEPSRRTCSKGRMPIPCNFKHMVLHRAMSRLGTTRKRSDEQSRS